MVLQLQYRFGSGLENLGSEKEIDTLPCQRNACASLSRRLSRRILVAVGLVVSFLSSSNSSWNFATFSVGVVWAEEAPTGAQYLRDAAKFYQSGQYFQSARYAFAADKLDPSLRQESYAWITMGLLHAGLPNSASYFFIRALQGGSTAAKRSVLTQTQDLLLTVGADLLRKYLIRHTRYEDYDSTNRSAYLFALGKDALLGGDPSRAIGYLSGIDSSSPLWPYGLQLRGAAHAILGKSAEAQRDFKQCAAYASQGVGAYSRREVVSRANAEQETEDLRSRCIAGQARTAYQNSEFEKADVIYDTIPKSSIVWTDILFEQAWNSFSRKEFNRALGKLVSYQSPALSFVYNSQIEVLRAQSYLNLCLYSDANDVINSFNLKYSGLGERVKNFVERNASSLPTFYGFGKQSLRAPRNTRDEMMRMAKHFLNGPYFKNLVAMESRISFEKEAIRRFDLAQTGVSHESSEGFPGFLNQVLNWRQDTIQLLGGAFVKNSLLDYHAALLDDFDKMAFIKLEMLKLAKDKLINLKTVSIGRDRGNKEPSRRDGQYRWSFNGEFWNDELGDYVFGLESECKS